MGKIRLLITLFAVSVLAACGSGGGGTAAPAPVSNTTVSGVASKGPFKKDSAVNVYGVANGSKGSLIVSTKTTDDNGSYSASLGSYTGAVIVEVSGTYKDEATGADVAISSPIRAALPNASGNVTLPVTALTELAVKKMSAFDSTAITSANNQVSSIFKVDIINTMPVPPSAAELAKTGVTQAQKDYTLALAVVSQMASTATGANSAAKLESAMNSLSSGVTGTELSSEAKASFQTALSGFVSNSNNQTGITDVAQTPLAAIGATSKTYKLSVSGVTQAQAKGIQFDLVFPAGVTVNLGSDLKTVADSSLSLSGSSALNATSYANGKLVFGAVSTNGFSAGEFATLTGNIQAGVSAPEASAFVISNARVIDSNGTPITGATVTMQ